MIAVMMRVEDVLDRLRGGLLDIEQAGLRAAREIRIHDDHVVLHLDPDVVAVALVFDFSFAKPDAGRNHLHVAGRRAKIALNAQVASHSQQRGEANPHRKVHVTH